MTRHRNSAIKPYSSKTIYRRFPLLVIFHFPGNRKLRAINFSEETKRISFRLRCSRFQRAPRSRYMYDTLPPGVLVAGSACFQTSKQNRCSRICVHSTRRLTQTLQLPSMSLFPLFTLSNPDSHQKSSVFCFHAHEPGCRGLAQVPRREHSRVHHGVRRIVSSGTDCKGTSGYASSGASTKSQPVWLLNMDHCSVVALEISCHQEGIC